MGGNALKNCITTRVPKARYLELETEVTSLLAAFFKKFKIPYYFPDKADFGDIDIVCVVKDGYNIEDVAVEVLNSKDRFINGNVCSVEYKRFQTDLIVVKEEDFDTTHAFLSWSLFGKLIGMVCNWYDIKFGNQGLFKKIRYSKTGEHLGNIILCSDIREIFDFLGLDYSKFNNGFKTQEEMFDFVIGGRLFKPCIFHSINRNDNGIKHRLDIVDSFISRFKTEDPPDKETKQAQVDEINKEAFSNFGKEEELKHMIAKHERKLAIKQLFNGDVVTKITGLQNKELGKFMAYLRAIDRFLDMCVESNDAETVNREIKSKFEHYTQRKIDL